MKWLTVHNSPRGKQNKTRNAVKPGTAFPIASFNLTLLSWIFLNRIFCVESFNLTLTNWIFHTEYFEWNLSTWIFQIDSFELYLSSWFFQAVSFDLSRESALPQLHNTWLIHIHLDTWNMTERAIKQTHKRGFPYWKVPLSGKVSMGTCLIPYQVPLRSLLYDGVILSHFLREDY